MTYDLTPTSILSLLETTKEQRKSFATQVVEAVKEGHLDPRKVQLQLKCTESLIKDISDDKEYKEILLSECQKQGKSHDFHNAKFEVKEVGSKYDYSVCEDVTYNELSAQMEALKVKMKEREKFLQNVPEEGIADPENGNMIYRAAKSSTTSIAVTLK